MPSTFPLIFISWDTSFPITNWAIEKMVPFFGCLGYIRDEILPSYTGIIKSTTSYFFFVAQLISCFIFSKRDVGRLVFAQAIFAWSWLFQDWQDWVRSPMLGCFLVGRNDDLLDVWLGVRSSRWRSYIDWRSCMYIWTFMDIGLDYWIYIYTNR